MAALYTVDCDCSRLTIFPVILVNCNTELVFSTGSVGKQEQRSVRTRIVLKQDIYTQNHPR